MCARVFASRPVVREGVSNPKGHMCVCLRKCGHGCECAFTRAKCVCACGVGENVHGAEKSLLVKWHIKDVEESH